MRLSIEVLPLAAEDAHGPHQAAALAAFKGRKFALPTQLDLTFEQLWGQIEYRYKKNYLTPLQASSFTIKKLQDAYECDLDLSDTVGAIFEGENDPQMRVVRVVPSFVNRDFSMPATSNLRPGSAQKRTRHNSEDQANKRRRLEEAQQELMDMDPARDRPLSSTESSNINGDIGTRSTSSGLRGVDGSRRSKSGSEPMLVSNVQTGRREFGVQIKEESPELGLSPALTIPESPDGYINTFRKPLLPASRTTPGAAALSRQRGNTATYQSPKSTPEQAESATAPPRTSESRNTRAPSDPPWVRPATKPTIMYGRSPTTSHIAREAAELLNHSRSQSRIAKGASGKHVSIGLTSSSKVHSFQKLSSDEIDSTPQDVAVDEEEAMDASTMEVSEKHHPSEASSLGKNCSAKTAHPGALKKPSYVMINMQSNGVLQAKETSNTWQGRTASNAKSTVSTSPSVTFITTSASSPTIRAGKVNLSRRSRRTTSPKVLILTRASVDGTQITPKSQVSPVQKTPTPTSTHKISDELGDGDRDEEAVSERAMSVADDLHSHSPEMAAKLRETSISSRSSQVSKSLVDSQKANVSGDTSTSNRPDSLDVGNEAASEEIPFAVPSVPASATAAPTPSLADNTPSRMAAPSGSQLRTPVPVPSNVKHLVGRSPETVKAWAVNIRTPVTGRKRGRPAKHLAPQSSSSQSSAGPPANGGKRDTAAQIRQLSKESQSSPPRILDTKNRDTATSVSSVSSSSQTSAADAMLGSTPDTSLPLNPKMNGRTLSPESMTRHNNILSQMFPDGLDAAKTDHDLADDCFGDVDHNVASLRGDEVAEELNDAITDGGASSADLQIRLESAAALESVEDPEIGQSRFGSPEEDQENGSRHESSPTIALKKSPSGDNGATNQDHEQHVSEATETALSSDSDSDSDSDSGDEEGNGFELETESEPEAEIEPAAETEPGAVTVADGAELEPTSTEQSIRSSPAVARGPARFLSHSPTPEGSTDDEGSVTSKASSESHAITSKAVDNQVESDSDESSDGSDRSSINSDVQDEDNEMPDASTAVEPAANLTTHATSPLAPLQQAPILVPATQSPQKLPRPASQILLNHHSQPTPTASAAIPSSSTIIPASQPTPSRRPLLTSAFGRHGVDMPTRRAIYKKFPSLSEQLREQQKPAAVPVGGRRFDPRTASFGRMAARKGTGSGVGKGPGKVVSVSESESEDSSSSSSSSESSSEEEGGGKGTGQRKGRGKDGASCSVA